jgi:hypothetical protein
VLEGAQCYLANEMIFSISYTFMINGVGCTYSFVSTALTTKSLLYILLHVWAWGPGTGTVLCTA